MPSPTATHNERDYPFSPDAMLPAWFVTDRDLCIQRQSDFATDLVRSCSSGRDLKGRLSLQMPVPDGYESLWNCILDRNYDNNFLYVEEALKVFRKHVAILDDFNTSYPRASLASLVRRLREVIGLGDIVTSYTYFNPDGEILKLGVKISPPQGLKLQSTVELEGTSVEYIDVVMAYQLLESSGADGRKRIEIEATQPAIHDVTVRHRLWEETKQKTKEKEEARITQFLSHALKTPLANTQRILNTIKIPGLDKVVREELILELESLIGDVEHLVSLLLFISSTVGEIAVSLRMVSNSDDRLWEQFDVEEIESAVASALQSVHNRRTGREIDVDKIGFLLKQQGLSVPSHDAEAGGTSCFKSLARALMKVELDKANQEFAICPLIKTGNLETSDVSKKAKTVLLDLLLVELIVNAVKNADESKPELSIKVRLSEPADKLQIHVVNNGREFGEGTEADVEGKRPGEKRRALGLLLNKKAADALEWHFGGQPLPEYGTVFAIEIPLKK